MTMSDDDICGYEETTTGEPCRHPAGSCPVPTHGDSNAENPQGRPCALRETPAITEVIAGELQNGATIPEACAEAQISTRQYFEWRRRGEDDDEDDVFRDFRDQTGRARKVDSREKRRRLWDEALEQGDIRTAYKLYHDQHGDTFDDEGGNGDAAEGIPLVVPDTARPDQ